jgi:hypothetical protein
MFQNQNQCHLERSVILVLKVTIHFLNAQSQLTLILLWYVIGVLVNVFLMALEETLVLLVVAVRLQILLEVLNVNPVVPEITVLKEV